MNPFNIKGKRIIVTGASSGIGKVVAKHLASEGAHLVITGRNVDRLADVLEEINRPKELDEREHSKERVHKMISGDLTDNSFVKELGETAKIIGGFNGVVHCAGTIRLLPFLFQSEDSFRELMEINYFAPVRLLHRLLKEKKGILKFASIVLISSITSSDRGTGGGSIYGSSKGALEGLVRSLSVELGKSRIRVNTIAPGMVETEAIEALSHQITPEALKKDQLRYPLGRYGSPLDVAYACHYLLSEASSWVTGTRLVVDGGISSKV